MTMPRSEPPSSSVRAVEHRPLRLPRHLVLGREVEELALAVGFQPVRDIFDRDVLVGLQPSRPSWLGVNSHQMM